ncbi:refilin-A-like [Tubulanus polymorphus]|uniref:refilin-A-like n=1 Tax=Tubulanus polymorphus TaxID=672921 RepID=UPI003DA1EE30
MKDVNSLTRMIPTNYVESISVDPESEREETKVTSIFRFDSEKRHKNAVKIKLVQTPVSYGSTIIKYAKNSTSTHYVSSVELAPKNKPVEFSETVYVLPKSEKISYRCIYYRYVEPGKKWYTTEVNLSPSVSCELAPSSKYVASVAVELNGSRNGDLFDDSYEVDGFSSCEPMFRSYPSTTDALVFTNGDCDFPYINGDLNGYTEDDIEV